MQIIKKRQSHKSVTFCREFNWKEDNSGGGFSFPCDEKGNVDIGSLQPAGLKNYQECLNGSNGTVDAGVRRFEHWYHEPAIGLCNGCPREVVLHGFTNTCDCGIDYNGSGMQLASREQWGEETGEHWTECLGSSFDSDSEDY